MVVLEAIGHQTKQKRVEDIESEILGFAQPIHGCGIGWWQEITAVPKKTSHKGG